MKATVKSLRLMIESIVTLNTLETIRDELDDMLMNDFISVDKYNREWNDALRSVGWTQEKYDLEIDRRWDYVDKLEPMPPRRVFN